MQIKGNKISDDKYKIKVMQIIHDKNMFCIMNNTKWRELQISMRTELPFPPPYDLKIITEDKSTAENFDNDVYYLGDWSDEALLPFYKIEWIKIRPAYMKFRGHLIKEEKIDETIKLLEILKTHNIPYEEDSGVYTIYGYK